MKKYICTVEVKAEPMTKEQAEKETGKVFDEFDNPKHEGYLCYFASGTRFIDKEAFLMMYQCVDSYVDRMGIEYRQLLERTRKLGEFIDSDKYKQLNEIDQGLLNAQYGAMIAYRQILCLRYMNATGYLVTSQSEDDVDRK